MAFKTMYPAVAGSPTTTTENTFVAGTTTSLTVSQGSVLAAAPNLATITAADGRFVTVSYTSKSGNTISGLTALEGDKTGTFATGSIIARRYSAVDDSAIKDNIQGIVSGISSVLNVYVSPSGSDTTGDGTQAKPWREIQTAINNTANEPNSVVVVNCAQGEYQVGVNISDDNTKNIGLNIDTNVTINGKIYVGSGKLTINKAKSNDTTLSIVTTEETGIEMFGGVEISSYVNNLNITAANKGIRCVSKYTGVSRSGNNTRFISQRNVNINLTGASACVGVDLQYYSNVIFSNLTITATAGKGINIVNVPSIACIKNLTTELTRYSIGSGSLLSIDGKWVNQT